MLQLYSNRRWQNKLMLSVEFELQCGPVFLVLTKIIVFWTMIPCSWVYRHLLPTYSDFLLWRWQQQVPQDICASLPNYILSLPQDRNLHIHCCDNLKSHSVLLIFMKFWLHKRWQKEKLCIDMDPRSSKPKTLDLEHEKSVSPSQDQKWMYRS